MPHPQAALLIIDMQTDVLDRLVPGSRAIVPAVARLREACREAGIPVVHIRRSHRASGVDVERFRVEAFRKDSFLVEGTPGAEIIAELTPLPDEQVVNKTRFSGFFQTDLHLLLTRLGVNHLIVAGVQTPNCVRATVTDGIAHDYDVTVVSDATAARSEVIHQSNLDDMVQLGARIVPLDALLAEITKS